MFVTVGYYKIMEIKQTRSEIKIETLQKETSAKGLCSLGTRYHATAGTIFREGPETQTHKVLCQEVPKAPLWFYWWKTRQWVRNLARSGHFSFRD